MATEIIKDIDTYDSNYLFKTGIFFCFFFIILVVLFKNINNNNSIPFVATFNYVEGINDDAEVKLAGIKVGDVNKIVISQDEISISGYIDSNYDIPEDSIMKIKSDGIFGKKSLYIEPGFGEYLDKSDLQYNFNQNQDSYSVDMFLRYLNDLNE